MKKRLRNYWTAAQALLITLRWSLSTLFSALFHRLSRERVNRIVYRWSRSLLNAARVTYTIVKHAPITFHPNRPYVLMSNHESHYDIPLLVMAFPTDNLRMLAKRELFRVPIWGHAMRAAEFPPIDRVNFRRAFDDLRHAQAKMKTGIKLWISPEGQRSTTGELSPFKKGGFMVAQKLGATIIPVGIRGSRRILPPYTLDFQLHQSVEIHIGEPIEASDYSPAQIKSLMQHVERRIRDLLTPVPSLPS